MEIQKRDSLTTITECHLRNMGVASTAVINGWFQASYAGDYTISGMEKAVEKTLEFREKAVYVFGDYDCDGIMATAIMVRALKWYGFKDVKYRIPRRFTEGYGLNSTMVDEIAEPAEDVLIVTVDNGIAALDAVEYAKEKGYTVIVTDHHLPAVDSDGNTVLPDVENIIDPQAIPKSAKFAGYCGAGIAYLFALKLFETADSELQDRCRAGIKALQVNVMLATLCDQMDLTEENYVFVRNGLEKIRKGICVPGLTALTEVIGVQYWEADTALFHAGPCLNALERMRDGAAKAGVELMICDDIDRCREIAAQCKEANDERKAAVELATAKIYDTIKENGVEYPLIVYAPGVSMGLIGLIAGRVCEKYGIPAGVFSDDTDGVLKGSFRAPDGYDVKQTLDQCAETMIQYGGHAQAAGVTVSKDGFDAFRTAMVSASTKPDIEAGDELLYDIEIKAEDIEKAIEENEKFAPFGNGNEDLVFKITDFDVIPNYGEYRSLMRGNTVKVASKWCKAVGFGMKDKTEEIDGPCTLTLYGSIGWNRFNGRKDPNIRFFGVEVQKKEKDDSPMARHLKQMAKAR